MNGYDPAADLGDALDELTAPVTPAAAGTSRAPGIAPPRRTPRSDTSDTSDTTAATPTDAAAPPVNLSPADLEPSAETGKDPVAPTAAPTPAAAPAVPAKRGRGRPRQDKEPGRSTSAHLPAGLVDALMLRRLSEQAAGRRFVLSDWVDAAIMSLPTTAKALLRELDRYGSELNIGLVARDDGWKATRLLSLRLSAAADQHLDRAVLELFRGDRNRVTRQDLIGVAIVRALATMS